MLVLSRKRDEKIVIGDDIVLTVVDIRGDKVRLGIEAPKDVPVHRGEIHTSAKRAELVASGAPVPSFGYSCNGSPLGCEGGKYGGCAHCEGKE